MGSARIRAREEQIVRLGRMGYRQAAIAKEAHVSQATVSRVLRNHGVDSRLPLKRYRAGEALLEYALAAVNEAMAAEDSAAWHDALRLREMARTLMFAPGSAVPLPPITTTPEADHG